MDLNSSFIPKKLIIIPKIKNNLESPYRRVVAIILGVTITIIIVGFIIYFSINRVDVNNKSPDNVLSRSTRDKTSNTKDEEKNRNVDKIKQLMISDRLLTIKIPPDELKKLLFTSIINSDIQLPSRFNNWETDHKKIIYLSHFGIRLLQTYKKSKNQVYEKVAAAIVEKIYREFDNISKLYSERKSSEWISICINFMKFLVVYEYIGNDETIKKSICHNFINKNIPKFNYGNEVWLDDSYSLQFAMTRLLANYLYDHQSFINDSKLMMNEKSILSLNLAVNETDDIKEGIYEDGSCISEQNIPFYKYLLRYLNSSQFYFYEKLYHVIIPKIGNLPQIVKKISEKLFHPRSRHIPFGLFNTEGFTILTNWQNINGINGVFILPFTGLGIFKTEDIMFSVRVQRPGLAACQLDNQKSGDFILGSIQLRQIYLTHQRYSSKLTWNDLINEPGIVSITKTDEVPKRYLTNSNLETNSYSCEWIDSYNFVGCLPDSGGILFWFNNYMCSLIRSYVTEVGVFTNNGLDSYYIIHNSGPSNVQFSTGINSLAENLLHPLSDHQLINKSEPSSVNGFVTFPPGDPDSLSWRVMFDMEKKTNISYDSRRNMISFSYESFSYNIFMKGKSRYVVERSDGQLFAGSSSSLMNHSMEIDGTTFKRDPATFMYSTK